MTVPARGTGGLRRQLPYLSVLLVAGAGITYSLADNSHWLRGVGLVGLALVLAGALRMTLSDESAGLLAVRRRPFDVACYWALAGAIIAVGNVLPH